MYERHAAGGQGDMKSFSDAVALVTGAGAGIGLAEVRQLTDRGARVCGVDIDEDAARGSGAALAIGADVSDRAAMAAAVQRCVRELGKLDLIICNAGITHPPSTLRLLEPGVAQRVFDVNLIGTLNTVLPSIEPLMATRGHIVLVSSLGWPPNIEFGAMLPAVGGVAYAASKVAVEMLGRGLRMELVDHDVSVTITYFGPVDTAMARMTLGTPQSDKAEKVRISPEEAAAQVLRAVERDKVRAIIPSRWRFLDVVRHFGVTMDNVLLRNKGQRELIRTYDSV
ncbi:short-chain dehydrogenase [Mycolicibacterium litorale]|uniref:Short-chain dehydrogenase n=1 Tax=Mycolicibacterium litorale TaxID=758802 RepID=A0A6S6P5Q5_9MYCO|nr:short-chain dehydrogenase [Mycolicibacterium litorale]